MIHDTAVRFLTTLAVLLALAAPAWAAGPQEAAAEALFQEGALGEVALLGQFESTIDLGTGSIMPSNPGSADFFLVRLAPP